MNKIGFAAFASLITGIAIAYPTKQELAEARPLVAELMNPVLTEYKGKTKSASDVAQISVQFSESAKSEAVKYLFLRGAVGYYINVKVTETSLRVQVVNVSTGEYEGNATVNF